MKKKRITTITEYKIKEKAEAKTKNEENKKELPPLKDLKIGSENINKNSVR